LAYLVFGLMMGGIIWWSHRENVKRLLAGNENKIV
jgi:glycerol-3-phosphate acyltransferase PlsY